MAPLGSFELPAMFSLRIRHEWSSGSIVVVDPAPVSSVPSPLPWHLLSPASYLIVWRELLMPWLKREDEGEEKVFTQRRILGRA